MAFEELDARVIGSMISIRLDDPSPDVSPRSALPTPPRPAAAPVQPDQPKSAAPNVARVSDAVSLEPAPETVVLAAPGTAEPIAVTKGKWRALFVMKPLNAERMRTAWALIAVVFVAMVVGDIWLHGRAKFIAEFLPSIHVPLKADASTAVTAALAQRTAPATDVTAPRTVEASATASTPTVQGSATVTQRPQPPVQPLAAAAPLAEPTTAAAVAVKAEPVKTVTVNPVPATVMALATPVLPIPPAGPLPVRRGGRPVPETPRHGEREVSQQPSEQNSPILVGGQYSDKATDSKGSESK
ncbi:hypothetical protein [Paraburkholderia humisilvae]|uniref:Uncharacterized protein n=1 Tax=Paraburkholderia humisilvae TaxID=627669 RepID=A0A6J5EMP0_9BURK|nr:hypothetical protein [Paraburkholderia humisilvae]CAB3767433.1 hypothetical protein LMG29542_05606 [Paraburkholderia humisilvae]